MHSLLHEFQVKHFLLVPVNIVIFDSKTITNNKTLDYLDRCLIRFTDKEKRITRDLEPENLQMSESALSYISLPSPLRNCSPQRCMGILLVNISKMASRRSRCASGRSSGHNVEEWKLARDWIVELRVLLPQSRATDPNSSLFDFAQSLRDGVILCQLANVLQPGAVNDVNTKSQMSQVKRSVLLD